MPKDLEPGVVNVTYGDLDHGFRFWDEEWLLLTENDIFGMQKRKRLHTKNQGQQLQYFRISRPEITLFIRCMVSAVI